MLKNAPTASEIRAANRKAVGGGRKRCRKGKNCSATCIDQGKDCLVGLPEPVSVATTKVSKMLQSKQGGGGSAPAAAPAPTPVKAASTVEELTKRVTETGKVWARMQGTPQGAAAKAEFEKAKQDLQKAKDAEAAAKSAKTSSLLEGLKQAANPKSTRGLTPSQDEEIGNATRATNTRIDRKLNERQFYDDATNARIRAQNEKVVAPFQKLSEDEKGALALYGQNGVKYYQQVNQMLRKGQMDDSTPDKVKMAEFVSSNLRSGLEKLPPAEVNDLRRAVSGNVVGSLGKLKVGDVLEDKGFGSYTTESKSPTLDQFLKKDQPNAIIRVVNPKGARLVAPVMEYSSEDEKGALALYGQNGVKYYQQVNQMLRKGQMDDSTPDKVKMAEFVSSNLRSGLEKLPPAEVNDLRRAVSGNVVGSLGKLKVGDVLEDKGFGSYTTESKSPTLDQFLKKDQPNAIIRVVSPKGARRVAPIMEYESEDEHIMLPGSRFRLVDVQEKGAYSRKVGYTPMYTFEEVTE